MSGVYRAAILFRSKVPGLVPWYAAFWDWKENAKNDKVSEGKWDTCVSL